MAAYRLDCTSQRWFAKPPTISSSVIEPPGDPAAVVKPCSVSTAATLWPIGKWIRLGRKWGGWNIKQEQVGDTPGYQERKRTVRNRGRLTTCPDTVEKRIYPAVLDY